MTTRKKKRQESGGSGGGGGGGGSSGSSGFIKKVSSLFNLDSVIVTMPAIHAYLLYTLSVTSINICIHYSFQCKLGLFFLLSKLFMLFFYSIECEERNIKILHKIHLDEYMHFCIY